MVKQKTKMLKWCVFTLGVLIILSAGAYKLMNSRIYQIAGDLIHDIETDEKVVYLTFDDGPTQETSKILEVLDEVDVKATFFLIGSNIENNMQEAESIVNAGHAIGNHTYSHNRMILKSPKFIKEEIDKTNELIRDIGYNDEILFRPPYAKKLVILPMYLNKLNQTTLMWNIEPESYPEFSKDSETIAQHVIDNVKNGSIILLHPMNDKTDKTINAIRIIATTLKEQGYSFEVLNK